MIRQDAEAIVLCKRRSEKQYYILLSYHIRYEKNKIITRLS